MAGMVCMDGMVCSEIKQALRAMPHLELHE